MVKSNHVFLKFGVPKNRHRFYKGKRETIQEKNTGLISWPETLNRRMCPEGKRTVTTQHEDTMDNGKDRKLGAERLTG